MNRSLVALGFVFVGALLASVVVGNSVGTTSGNVSESREARQLNGVASIRLAAVRAESPEDRIAISSDRSFVFTETAVISPLALPTSEPPEIDAEAAAVKEVRNSYSLFNLNTEKRWPIASLTKLMTVLIAFEQLGPDTSVSISEAAVTTEGISGNFEAGEKYTVYDLSKALLVVSSNDAAAALRETYNNEYGAGSFVDLMNQRAQSLAMRETTFADATGLSILNQSTIDDLVKLVEYISGNYPKLFEVSKGTETSIRELVSGKRRKLLNINYLAGDSRFLGGKTGFIDEAGGNLISILEYQGRPILIIVLGSKDQDERFNDTELLYNWLTNN